MGRKFIETEVAASSKQVTDRANSEPNIIPLPYVRPGS
jgi:hypothetical protein